MAGTPIGCGGERRKLEEEYEDKEEGKEISKLTMIKVAAYKPRRIPPPLWRDCIKKIWEVAPLSAHTPDGYEDHKLYRGEEGDPEDTSPPEAVAGPGCPWFPALAWKEDARLCAFETGETL